MMSFIFLLIVNSISAFALTNSQPALDPQFNSTVYIQTESRDFSDNSDAPAICNATLLSSKVLVTAGHCVKDAQALKSFEIRVQVGQYVYHTKPDGTVRRIGYGEITSKNTTAKFLFTPNVTDRISRQGLKTELSPSEDVAIIILAESLQLPVDFPYAHLVTQKDLQSIKNILGQYMPTVVSVNYMSSISDVKKQATLNKIDFLNNGTFESKSSSEVEPGDSGSPLFVRIGKQWTLVGVVKGRAETFFSHWDVFSAMDAKMCVIANQITDLENKKLICP